MINRVIHWQENRADHWLVCYCSGRMYEYATVGMENLPSTVVRYVDNAPISRPYDIFEKGAFLYEYFVDEESLR